MLYTGHSAGLSRDQAHHVIEIAKGLDLDITSEMIDIDREINSYDDIDTDQDSSLIPCDDNDVDQNEDNCNQALRINTKIVNKHGSLALSFPESISIRQPSHLKINENMGGFHGRVHKEYNAHPVGKYMGPYDQNKKLELRIQLPDSDLDFRKYTEFYHGGKECFDLSLKSYESYGDMAKIDSYRIVAKIVDIVESNSDSDD